MYTQGQVVLVINSSRPRLLLEFGFQLPSSLCSMFVHGLWFKVYADLNHFLSERILLEVQGSQGCQG